jgi:hypothetical protein
MVKVILILQVMLLQSCVPDVYLIDRQTVFESEASGQWPELDKVFYRDSAAKGPLEIEKDSKAMSKQRVYNTLHSDSFGSE